MSPQPVILSNSALHLLDSQRAGRTYRITVSLPLGYDAPAGDDWPFNDIPALWPTVYVLDGDWYAEMVTGMVRAMRWCGSTTDAIIVGIGYPQTDNPREDLRTQFVRRNQDLTPVPDASAEREAAATFKRPSPHGNAASFHNFIKDELIPFIESQYRADPKHRILLGHSYGGLFGLFGLFTTPDLFSTLILGSPTLAFGNRFTFEQEAAFAKEHRQLPVKIYLYAAENEEFVNDTTLSDTIRMGAILHERRYEGLTLVRHIFANENHCEVAAPAFQWGLKYALRT